MPDRINTVCPKAEEVAALSVKLDSLKVMIEELRNEIRINTQARIYEEGLAAGRKEGLSKIVGYSITIINVIARVISTGILLGVLIAAGNTVGAIDLIVKVFSAK